MLVYIQNLLVSTSMHGAASIARECRKAYRGNPIWTRVHARFSGGRWEGVVMGIATISEPSLRIKNVFANQRFRNKVWETGGQYEIFVTSNFCNVIFYLSVVFARFFFQSKGLVVRRLKNID